MVGQLKEVKCLFTDYAKALKEHVDCDINEQAFNIFWKPTLNKILREKMQSFLRNA